MSDRRRAAGNRGSLLKGLGQALALRLGGTQVGLIYPQPSRTEARGLKTNFAGPVTRREGKILNYFSGGERPEAPTFSSLRERLEPRDTAVV